MSSTGTCTWTITDSKCLNNCNLCMLFNDNGDLCWTMPHGDAIFNSYICLNCKQL